MVLPKIADCVKGKVKFQYYRDGELWYKTENNFKFPVPVPGDVGNATFLDEDKAILFMRYIRKHLDMLGVLR